MLFLGKLQGGPPSAFLFLDKLLSELFAQQSAVLELLNSVLVLLCLGSLLSSPLLLLLLLSLLLLRANPRTRAVRERRLSTLVTRDQDRWCDLEFV